MECSSVGPCDLQRVSGVHTQGMSSETLSASSGYPSTTQRKKEAMMVIYDIFSSVCKDNNVHNLSCTLLLLCKHE